MDRIHFIALSALRESPFNPRKAYAESDLQELAESIRSQGVLQPIVVRPLPESQTDIEHTHELVFGHRRFRAAALAELEDLPCIVRVMTDREAAIAQTHENAKRADVTPFEEADSFAHLMDEHGLSADQVAEAVGKSRSYVYGRLKLHNAAPVVRQAFAEQGLSAEIALELARIPNHKIQGEALKRVKADYGDGWLSVREAKHRLKSRYVFDLAEAEFDLGDATLLPAAGSCHACPHASFNDPDLASEPGHFCIQKACYEQKTEARHEQHLVELASTGHTVLRGDQAKAFMPQRYNEPDGYTRAQAAGSWHQGRYLGYSELLELLSPAVEKPRMTVVVFDGPGDTVQLLRDEDVEWLHQAAGVDHNNGRGADGGGAAEEPMADWTPAERLTRDHAAWQEVRKAAVLGVAQQARTVEDLRLVLHEQLDLHGEFGNVGIWLGIHGDEADTEQVHQWIDLATPDQLATLLVADALNGALSQYAKNSAVAAVLVQLAKAYGVDVDAIAAPPAEPASTPSLAARARGKKRAPAAPAAAGGTEEPEGQMDNDDRSAAVEPAEAAL